MVLGTADFLASFCQPPWQGLFHLVAVVDQAIAREVASECTMLVGAGMPLERMAELLNALAWPDSIAQGQTQRSSIQGQALWQGDGALPKALKRSSKAHPFRFCRTPHYPTPYPGRLRNTILGCQNPNRCRYYYPIIG